MVPIPVEPFTQPQHLRRTGFHAQSAAFAFFGIQFDYAAIHNAHSIAPPKDGVYMSVIIVDQDIEICKTD
jgi:hypothetical protein